MQACPSCGTEKAENAKFCSECGAALLWAEEDYVQAALVLDEIGALPFAAEARLKAAEKLVAERRRPGADAQLRLALEFFRSVGATAFVREGEALFEAAG